MKITPILCLFCTVNTKKAILHYKNVIFALCFTIQMSFGDFMIKLIIKIIDEVCLINIQLSGGLGNFRGSRCRKNSFSAIILPICLGGLKLIV